MKVEKKLVPWRGGGGGGGGRARRNFHRTFAEKTTSLRTASPTVVAIRSSFRASSILSPRATYGMSRKIREIQRSVAKQRATNDASFERTSFRDRSVPMVRPVYPIPNKNVGDEFSSAACRMESGARCPCAAPRRCLLTLVAGSPRRPEAFARSCAACRMEADSQWRVSKLTADSLVLRGPGVWVPRFTTSNQSWPYLRITYYIRYSSTTNHFLFE